MNEKKGTYPALVLVSYLLFVGFVVDLRPVLNLVFAAVGTKGDSMLFGEVADLRPAHFAWIVEFGLASFALVVSVVIFRECDEVEVVFEGRGGFGLVVVGLGLVVVGLVVAIRTGITVRVKGATRVAVSVAIVAGVELWVSLRMGLQNLNRQVSVTATHSPYESKVSGHRIRVRNRSHRIIVW